MDMSHNHRLCLLFPNQIWAHAYRDNTYYAAIDTNNGTESLNKALKYSYLPKRKSLTLSGIATLLIDRFLPDMWQKYIFHNYKLSEEYRNYSKDIPDYLKGRPKSVIFHCLERKAKCHKFTKDDIKEVMDGMFEILKSDGSKHLVNFNVPECTCKDWTRHHIPCKHFFAVFEQCPGWDWFKLPLEFQGSCYLSADTNAIDKYLTPTETSETAELVKPISQEMDQSLDQKQEQILPSIPIKQVYFHTLHYCIYTEVLTSACRDHH